MEPTVTQSPEADIDREIESLLGDSIRGMLTREGRVRLSELQSRRLNLMRPDTFAIRRMVGFHSRRLTA